jgi:hypothetical protein
MRQVYGTEKWAVRENNVFGCRVQKLFVLKPSALTA